MAEIRPLRAWRYTSKSPYPIHLLISPLFDVVSGKQRKELRQNPHNSVHLSSPLGYGNSLEDVVQRLEMWKAKEIIAQDKLPGIYVYYKYFKLAGSEKIYCRKGFVAYVRTHYWEDGIVLRHENTMPKTVNDQVELLAKTQFHVSATHSLYTDKKRLLEKWMDEAISNPIYEVESEGGAKDVLAVIHDKEIIDQFVTTLQDKKILLADGHHRYQGSIDYRKAQQAKNPNHQGDEGYNFHLTYLSNTESNDLQVLPTHRLISDLDTFSKEHVLHELANFFHIKPVEITYPINKAIDGKPHTFGIFFKGESYSMQLKSAWKNKISWDISEVIKQLDVTLLHYFVFEKIFKIPHKEQRFIDKIQFDHSLASCRHKVDNNEAHMAIVMQEVSIESVKTVCQSGHVMPQKSTYFYPKLVCGFLFGSIKASEFQLFADPTFQ